MWCTGAICNQVYLASLCVALLQPLICRIQSNALWLLVYQNNYVSAVEYLLGEEHRNPWHWLEQHCSASFNAVVPLLCALHLEATLQSANGIASLERCVKRTRITRVDSTTNPQVSAIFLSTTKSETKLAEVKIVTQPFHSIKKPVHAKIRFSPACHNFGH